MRCPSTSRSCGGIALTEVAVISPKDPYAFSGGDMKLVRLNLAILADLVSVKCIALSDAPASPAPIPVRIVPKGPIDRVRLLPRAVASRRSLIHARFRSRALSEAVEETGSDCFIAEHTYMAESITDGLGLSAAKRRLYINSHVLEADVFSGTGSLAWLRKREAERIRRDERRCFDLARSVAAYDRAEVEAIASETSTAVHEIKLVLPPSQTQSPGSGGKVAMFVGDLNWPPNLQAVQVLVRVWPKIRRYVKGAELRIVGQQAGYSTGMIDDTIKLMGFVDNIERAWAEADVLIAPIMVGGGVRVKILEAASFGVPVVTTEAGLGSIGGYLPMVAARTEEEIIEGAVRILKTSSTRKAQSDAIFEANRDSWENGFVHSQFEDWLGLS